jgi:glycine cleavage system H protein
MEHTESSSLQASKKEDYCIWMEAGMVAYKLCDLEFKCDACPLDTLMRQRGISADEPPRSSFHDATPQERPKSETAAEQFDRQLDEFFQPLLAVHLPDDRLYHRCHMWVRNDSQSSYTIGIDHIGAYFLQPVVSVVLPQTPSRMEQRSPCTWLVLREGTIALRSAIQGIATESNPILLDHPYLLLDDPYNSGWILKMAGNADKKDESGLLTAEEYDPLFRKEVGALKDKFAASYRRGQPDTGTTLFDGGEPIKTIQEILGGRKYFELISRIFAKP